MHTQALKQVYEPLPDAKVTGIRLAKLTRARTVTEFTYHEKRINLGLYTVSTSNTCGI